MLTYKCNDTKCDSNRGMFIMVKGKLEIRCAKCNKLDDKALIK